MRHLFLEHQILAGMRCRIFYAERLPSLFGCQPAYCAIDRCSGLCCKQADGQIMLACTSFIDIASIHQQPAIITGHDHRAAAPRHGAHPAFHGFAANQDGIKLLAIQEIANPVEMFCHFELLSSTQLFFGVLEEPLHAGDLPERGAAGRCTPRAARCQDRDRREWPGLHQ